VAPVGACVSVTCCACCAAYAAAGDGDGGLDGFCYMRKGCLRDAQILHTLYHTDENILLGAPTGSGKTISAELTILRAFTAHPGQKVIYIAPLKARSC